MLTATADMKVSLANRAATLAHCLRFTRGDGTVLQITDHDQAITVSGEGVFRANIGFTAAATLSSSISFGSQSSGIKMAMTDDGMREADVRAHKWDATEVTVYIVDWKNPTSAMAIFTGTFGRITINEKGYADIEVLGLGNSNPNIGGQQYSLTCRHDLGDTGCMANIENFRCDFTVVSVTDDFTFVVDTLHGQADGYFALGQLIWDTGNNTGGAFDVQTSNLDELTIGLFYPTTDAVQVGDTGHVYPGCDKLIGTCFEKFNNVVNFDGEPYNIQPRIISLPASSGSPVAATAAAQRGTGISLA